MKIRGDEKFRAVVRYDVGCNTLAGLRATIKASNNPPYYLAKFENDNEVPRDFAGKWVKLPVYLFEIEELIT